MTDDIVFHKAMNKVIENGFIGRRLSVKYPEYNDKDLVYAKSLELCEAAVSLGIYQGIIFSHEFAKCFWPDDLSTSWTRQDLSDGNKIHLPVITESWEFHLQRMVIKAEPIKYLTQFL